MHSNIHTQLQSDPAAATVYTSNIIKPVCVSSPTPNRVLLTEYCASTIICHLSSKCTYPLVYAQPTIQLPLPTAVGICEGLCAEAVYHVQHSVFQSHEGR